MQFRNGALLCLFPLFAATAPAQTIGGCPVFPANNIWNARVDTLPVHGRSAAWVNSISSTATLHQDFGGELYNGVEPGLPINLVSGSQPKVPITINEGLDESEPGPYPFPPNAKVEGGSDRHVMVVDTTNCLLYETFYSFKNPDNSWTVYSGAIFDLRKNLLRPQTWTSADAAGLPILPGLARYEEILEGEIRHALRFTAPRTTREYLWPARHFASYSNDANLPPMGARFRLKANFDVSSFSPTTQIILNGLKRYGMMLADNGSSWYIQGTFDPRWPNLADEWRRIPGSAFEAVDTSGLMESIDSAAVRGTVSTPTLSAAAVTPAAVAGGQNATVRVTLSGPAPAGGVQVTLASSNGSVAPIAPSVLIPEGSSSVDAPVTTSTVPSASTVTFTATLAGLNRQAALTVNPPAAALQAAAFLTSPVIGGQGATLRVSLSAPAGAGGVAVSLVSANQAVANGPGSAQIPSGATSVDVPVTTSTVSSASTVTFTATLAGLSRQAALTVNPPAASLQSAAFLTSPVIGGQGATLRVSLSGPAGAGGVTVSLVSANQAVASVPGSAQIPGGAASVDVPVTTSVVQAHTVAVFSITYAGITRQANLTVSPAPATAALNSVSLGSAAVTGGAAATLAITLTKAAPSGGLTLALVSSNPGAASVAGSVNVPAGSASIQVTVTTFPVASPVQTTLTVSANGVSRQASLTVNPPAVASLAVSPGSVQGGANATGTVSLNGRAPAGGMSVALSSANTGIAGTPGSVQVPAGQSTATFAVTTQTVTSSTSVQIRATARSVTATATLGVTAAPKTNPVLTALAAELLSDGRVRVSVALSGAMGPGGVDIRLKSSNSRVLNLNGRQVTVNWGASAGSAVFSAQPGSTDTYVLVAARLGTVTKTTTILIPR